MSDILTNPNRPMYEQIKTIILEKIESGELKQGAVIPSERELATTFNVSRMTARHAITDLEVEGYVYRVHGKGAIVAERKVLESVTDLIGFSEDMRRRGLHPKTKILRQQIVPANVQIQKKLHLSSASEPVLLLERLRFSSDVPMSHEVTYLPANAFPGIADIDLSGSLYETLNAHFNRGPVSARQTMEGEKADSIAASLLHIERGDVIIKLKRVSYDKGGIPIEYVEAAYRGDKYVFLANLRSISE
jgi:GntR family transcriptional regulator